MLSPTTADLFQHGEYLPLTVTGVKANHVVAFARKLKTTIAVIVVPRLVASIVDNPGIDNSYAPAPPIGADVWQDTQVQVPICDCFEKCSNIFTGGTVPLQRADIDNYRAVKLSDAFAKFPAAICELTRNSIES